MTKGIHRDQSEDIRKLNKIQRCVFPNLSDLLIFQSLIHASCMLGSVLVHGAQHQMCLGALVRSLEFIKSPHLSAGFWSPPICLT